MIDDLKFYARAFALIAEAIFAVVLVIVSIPFAMLNPFFGLAMHDYITNLRHRYEAVLEEGERKSRVRK